MPGAIYISFDAILFCMNINSNAVFVFCRFPNPLSSKESSLKETTLLTPACQLCLLHLVRPYNRLQKARIANETHEKQADEEGGFGLAAAAADGAHVRLLSKSRVVTNR